MLYSLLLILCAYLPFQLALNPSADVDMASGRIIILVAFFFWLADGLKNKKLRIKNDVVSFFVVSFLFLNFISLSVARNTDFAIRKLVFLFSVFPLYFVFLDVISQQKRKITVAKILILSGFFVAVIAILQFFAQFIFGLDTVYRFWASNVSPLFLGHNVTIAVLKNSSWLVNISGVTYLRAIATFPDPHMLAFFLGMLIPLALGIYLKDKKRFYLWAFSIMFLADLLTFSRGGYLGLFFGGLAFFLLSWRRLKKRVKEGLFLIFLAGMLILFIPSPISERFFSSFDLKDGSNFGRLEIWKKASRIILEHPIFGVGIGNYVFEVNPLANYRDPIYAHSLYLDIASETGFLGLASWLGLIIGLIFSFIKKAQKDSFFVYVILSMVVFSAHCLVETPLYSPIITPVFLIIASFNGINKNEKNN